MYIKYGMPIIRLSSWDRAMIWEKKNVKSFAKLNFLQVTMCINVVEVTKFKSNRVN
jgi:hypothetical protein